MVSFIIRSRCRRAILTKLGEGASTPTALSSAARVNRSHVSRTLRELRDRGLVEQLSDSRKGRIYGITKVGREILARVDELAI